MIRNWVAHGSAHSVVFRYSCKYSIALTSKRQNRGTLADNSIQLTEKAGAPGHVPRPDPPEGEHGGVVVDVEEAQLLLVLLPEDDEQAVRQLHQLADVIPPQSSGYPQRGRVHAGKIRWSDDSLRECESYRPVVHWLTGPAVLDLSAGDEDLQEDVEVEAGTEDVVDNHHRPQAEGREGGHEAGPS